MKEIEITKKFDYYFDYCLKLARKSFKNQEIPVGCIIVKNNQIIAIGKNNRQRKHSVLGHAEIIAIQKATKKVKDWRLDDCQLFVNLEPCDLCKTIIEESRLDKVYYLNKNNNSAKKINNEFKYANEKLEKYSQNLIQSFFKNLRD